MRCGSQLTNPTLVNFWLKANILPACQVESFETYRRPLDLPGVEELTSLLQNVTIKCQLSTQDESNSPPPTIEREQLIGQLVALQDQAQNDLPGLACVLNNWYDIENDDLVRHDEVKIALQQENLLQAFDPSTSPSSSTEMVSPEDSLDSEDDEVQPLTRMEALNSVNITEGTEMVRKVLQMMAVLGEDDTSHMLTTVYRKCLDLRVAAHSNAHRLQIRTLIYSPPIPHHSIIREQKQSRSSSRSIICEVVVF